MENFNTSVIMSFYKKMKDFKRVLPRHAHYLERAGIEVIIAVDEPTEYDELLDFIKVFPKINWRVIVNDNEHEWRNPCKAWNVAIRHATKDHILVIDPECEMATDVISILHEQLKENKTGFCVGQVIFVDYLFDKEKDSVDDHELVYYGTILAKRKEIEKVAGYTESYNVWGGEDDNLRAKLEKIGVGKIQVPEALVLHREDDKNGLAKRVEKSSALPRDLFNKSFAPVDDDFSNSEWGRDFNEVKYDYSKL